MHKSLELNRIFLPNDVREYWSYNVTSLITTSPNKDAKAFTCYDDYYCNGVELAKIGHVLLGIIGLLLTLMGLVLNVILIPVMSLVGIRSSATYYMIGIAISDICLLFLSLVLVVIRFLPNYDESDQLLIYQHFVAYFVPFGFPAKSVCQILTLSSCTGLLIDRIVFSKSKKKIKITKNHRALKTIVSIVAFVIVLKMPSFMLLKIVEKYDNVPTFITVTWTLLAKPWILIFNSIIFLFVYILLASSLAFLFYLSICKNGIIGNDMKYKNEVGLEMKIIQRERLYTAIALLIGLSTMILNIPHLLYFYFLGYYPTTRDINDRYKLMIVTMSMEIIDIALVVIKPLLYLIFAIHLRKALKDMIGLWIRPSNYKELWVSGGMGKIIDLRSGRESGNFNRSDTTDTLLKYCNSENKLNDVQKSITNSSMIDNLAKEQIQKETNYHLPICFDTRTGAKNQLKCNSQSPQKYVIIENYTKTSFESDNFNSTSSGICVDSSSSTCEFQQHDSKF